MKIEIKKATIKETKGLEKISRSANKEFSFWSFQSAGQFKKIIKNKLKGVYLAIVNKKIVGILVYKYDKEERRLWIEEVYLLKEFRNKGITKILILNATKKFNKIKYISIVLLTADRNKKIFERLGFKKTMNYMEFTKK